MIQKCINIFHAWKTRHLTWKISATEAFDLSDMKLSCPANCSNNYICRSYKPCTVCGDADQRENFSPAQLCTFFRLLRTLSSGTKCELKSVGNYFHFSTVICLCFLMLLQRRRRRGELRWIAWINHCVVNKRRKNGKFSTPARNKNKRQREREFSLKKLISSLAMFLIVNLPMRVCFLTYWSRSVDLMWMELFSHASPSNMLISFHIQTNYSIFFLFTAHIPTPLWLWHYPMILRTFHIICNL